MYCPQCSQEQVSEEMRFCSRCGFPLAIVTQLVRNGGALEGFDPEAKVRSPRQKGIRWGTILMVISALLVPVVALMAEMESDFIVLLIPVLLIFLFGLARLLYALLLQKTPTTAKTKSLSDTHRSALPAGQSIPVTNYRQPVNTAEMAQPHSVTDHTTRLLDDEK